MGSRPLAPVAQKFAGMEVGVMLGWMSTRVLGQYDLLIIEEESPHDQDIVYYVGPNILALEKLYAFPPREFATTTGKPVQSRARASNKVPIMYARPLLLRHLLLRHLLLWHPRPCPVIPQGRQ